MVSQFRSLAFVILCIRLSLSAWWSSSNRYFQTSWASSRMSLMLDNILIAHEMMHSVNHRKKGGWLHKAYGRIRWDFIVKVLRSFQFPNIWVSWIFECIFSTSLSVLINGKPSEFFRSLVGLRQGDLLSSYLFILCMKVLSKQLTALQDQGSLGGLRLGRSAPTQS